MHPYIFKFTKLASYMQLSYHPSSNLYNTQLSLIDNKHVVVRCIVGLLWIRDVMFYNKNIQLSLIDNKHIIVRYLDKLQYVRYLNT